MQRLIITCDETPRPPLNGNNRKTYELVQALRGSWEIHLLTYPLDRADRARVEETWRDSGVTCHFLTRHMSGRHVRMIWQGLSLPTVTRNFAQEAQIVRQLAGKDARARLLIDFISGAPLLQYLRGAGTILSGHDCMSYLFSQEERNSTSPARRAHFMVRRRLAANAERRFAHLAEIVHVVSEQDATELKRINPEARTTVIPLGGNEADPADLLPDFERKSGLIWGSLGSELIRSGVKRFLTATGAGRADLLRGWTLLGRLPEAEALRMLPEIRRFGLNYLVRVDNVGALLGRTRVLLLPDIGGTGQKNRALDGLAHGCIVCGLDEVFRGIVPEAGVPPYFACADYPALVQAVHQAGGAESAWMSGAAGRLFQQQFSRRVLAQRWDELLRRTQPLTVTAL